MKNLTSRKYTTPLVTFAFIAVGLTGLVMIFEVRGYALREIHIWTGALFLIGALVHVCLNWESLKIRLGRKAALIMMVPVLAIALLFAFSPDRGGRHHACKGKHSGYEAGNHGGRGIR